MDLSDHSKLFYNTCHVQRSLMAEAAMQGANCSSGVVQHFLSKALSDTKLIQTSDQRPLRFLDDPLHYLSLSLPLPPLLAWKILNHRRICGEICLDLDLSAKQWGSIMQHLNYHQVVK